MFGLLFFIAQFPALNFRHSSHITHYSLLITYHSKYPTRLALSLSCHYSIFFTLFVSSIPVTRWRIFFFFHSVSSNLVKKKKNMKTELVKKKKKKKKNRIANLGEERKKKKSQKWSKGVTGTVCGSPLYI